MHLGQFDIDVLASLRSGGMPDVDSSHRLRLEMAGLIVDGKGGLKLTTKGEIAARGNVEMSEKELEPEPPPSRVDSLGRRLARDRHIRMR